MSKNKINLIITTYAGKYNSEYKDNILRLNLLVLNKLNPDITTITIMKPKVNDNHETITNYYNFNDLNLDNIINKINILECDNIGISYGQFLTGIFNDINYDYDYYIFLEDDYVIFKETFAEEFINEYNKNDDKESLLCLKIYKNNFWDLNSIEYHLIKESNNLSLLQKILSKYDMHRISCNIPDVSLMIISKNTVQKIIKQFNNIENILEIFTLKFNNLWMYQVLFGYIINYCGIDIYDISESHLCIFNTTGSNVVLRNFDEVVTEFMNENKKFKTPFFIPIQMLNTFKYMSDIELIKKYIINEKEFFTYYNNINWLIYDNNFIITELSKDDYYEYMNIMFKFTNFKYDLQKDKFNEYIDKMNTNNNFKIMVIKVDNVIVGAGTIFKLIKLHNNPVGQIEDVIITEKYRKYGLGKKIIEKLVYIGINDMKCYKIVLNCIDKNIEFYKKCGFDVIGNEMKYNIK